MSAAEPDVAVEIASAFADAVRIKVDDLQVGDSVFDASGSRHEIVRVELTKRFVGIWRKDGWRDIWARGTDITIVRGAR